ncbi:terpene synthase family protein [Streptomyces sp. NPDC006733]|uniref:terpene synthase family protein n=1 Tax=Streptomyces sp. NPDC006733 TaxID=3155460 RepID=UPI0033E78E64
MRGVNWACRHGLISGTEPAIDYFLSMRLADVATGFSPYARGDDLDVMTDVITWTAVCDDFFDGMAGDDPGVAESVVEALSGVIGRNPVPLDPLVPFTPLVTATADLWERMAHPMGELWRARARRNWRRFLHSFLVEAEVRRSRSAPTLPEYFALRRETMAMYLYLDAAERAGGYEVPDRVLASEPVEELCRLQIEILACCNDVHSVEHEEARGDTHNLVLVLERTQGLRRSEAIETLREWVHRRSQRFLHVASHLLGTGNPLGLDADNRELAEQYVMTMMYQLRTTYDWSRSTARYSSRWQAASSFSSQQRPHYINL